MILFFLCLCSTFSDAGVNKIPAEPGGPGILFTPCVLWLRSSPTIRTFCSTSFPRPFRWVFRFFPQSGAAFCFWPSGLFSFSRFLAKWLGFFGVRVRVVSSVLVLRVGSRFGFCLWWCFGSGLVCASLLHLCISSCIGKQHCRESGRKGACLPFRHRLGCPGSAFSCWESSPGQADRWRVGSAGAFVTPPLLGCTRL